MEQLYILLDNIPSYNFPFCITKRPVIPGTKQRIEKQVLTHRNGSIVSKRGFEDRDITIEFNILENRNIKQDLRYFKSYFFNKKTLRFSDDDVYYMINNVEVGDFDNEITEYGIGSITFDIAPFDYAMTSPIIMNAPKQIKNFGTYKSEPLVKIYGKGDIEINFNEQIIKVGGLKDFIILDSELLLAYRNKNESMEGKMIGEFPTFAVGPIDINWKGDVAKVVIDGRWRFI